MHLKIKIWWLKRSSFLPKIALAVRITVIHLPLFIKAFVTIYRQKKCGLRQEAQLMAESMPIVNRDLRSVPSITTNERK